MSKPKDYPVADCIINSIFDNIEQRQKYCKKNCLFKCLKGFDYIKKGGDKCQM